MKQITNFWKWFQDNEEAIQMVMTAIEKAGYRPLDDIVIAMDAAASECWRSGISKINALKPIGA